MSKATGTTPLMRQYAAIKAQYPDAILLFRVGDFYETFNEDAVRISRLLGLTLTRRGKESDPTPLAGVPRGCWRSSLLQHIAFRPERLAMLAPSCWGSIATAT